MPSQTHVPRIIPDGADGVNVRQESVGGDLLLRPPNLRRGRRFCLPTRSAGQFVEIAGGDNRAPDGRGGGLRAADGTADDEAGADQDQVLDDVLAFKGRHQRESVEGDLRQQHERQHRPRHLEEEEEQRQPGQRPEQEADADRDLPPAEERDEDVGGQPVDGPLDQGVRRAETERLQAAEPDEDDPERPAEQRRPPPPHRRRDPPIEVVETAEAPKHPSRSPTPPVRPPTLVGIERPTAVAISGHLVGKIVGRKRAVSRRGEHPTSRRQLGRFGVRHVVIWPVRRSGFSASGGRGNLAREEAAHPVPATVCRRNGRWGPRRDGVSKRLAVGSTRDGPVERQSR